uniref:Uncharacterized protein n=1 Tax=Haptolina brevifila TaxID=156173 RepID=A0A7S2NLF4_9EUKA
MKKVATWIVGHRTALNMTHRSQIDRAHLETHYMVFKVSSDGVIGWTGEPTGPYTGQPQNPHTHLEVPPNTAPVCVPNIYKDLYPFAPAQQRYPPRIVEHRNPLPYEYGGSMQSMGQRFVAAENAITGMKASARSPQF